MKTISKLTPEQALEVVMRLSEKGGSIGDAVASEARNVLSGIELDEIADRVVLDLARMQAGDIERAPGTVHHLAAHAPAKASYTDRQGQYLAFIYYYTKVNGRSPSEADMKSFFQVSPPSVHQMIVNLEKLGFIQRTPGQGRSIKLLLTRSQLPDLT